MEPPRSGERPRPGPDLNTAPRGRMMAPPAAGVSVLPAPAGEVAAMTCPRCQTANPEGARFCLNCGAALAAPRPVEGERKFVTVLFADVVGSTAMGERLDPE